MTGVSDDELYRQYETVNLYRRGPGAKVELNRPERMNAWSRQFSADLRDAITEVTENPEVRAILITGAGRAFSSGADLKEAAEDAGGGPVDVYKILTERYHPLITGIRRMPKPVIAGVNGPAAGIGLSLALACDLVVAAESAYFSLAFVNIGLVPDGGSSLFVPSRVGFARAAELAMLGERLDARTALGWGLINRVWPDEEYQAQAQALLDRMAARRHQVLRRDQAPAQQVAVRAHGRPARVRGGHPEGDGRLRRLRRGTGGLRREAAAPVQRGLRPPGPSAILDTPQLERVYRAEAPRITAALAARIGDVGLAADAVQDAFVEALEHWRDAPPPNPGGWLATTARRKAIDRLRRDRAGQEKLALLAATATEAFPETEAADDELLGMVFACCHPALPRESQIALTLRAVCGLTTAEIAAAFLAAEPAMTQRLLRARKALRAAGADMRLPDPDQLADRLAEVLAVVYLVFNEGYLASAGRQPARRDLAAQAVALTRLLHRLMPREPEVLGLLALLLLHESRAATRFDGWGRLVRLADQDRTRWNRALIAEATGLLDRALTQRASGPYQVQAAIAALHAEAPDYEHTDWRQIRILYDRLQELTPSPVVLLNRAVATRYVVGPEAALAEITPLAADLDGYRLFHALRAGLLTGLGRDDEAREASERALALAGNPAERELLARRLSF